MNAKGKLIPSILVALPLMLLSMCKAPVAPVQATCDCSTFPPKQGCETQCGITTGIVEEVKGDSVVIRIPSVQKTAAGGEAPAMSDRTFKISGEEADQLKSIGTGSRVALTFSQETNQNVVASIRKIPGAPAK